MESFLGEFIEAPPTSEVLLRHGYELLYSVVERIDVKVYHCAKLNDNSNNRHLFKVEEYTGIKQSTALFNHQWLRHENLLPYADHFNDGNYFYYLSDITLPSALRFLEMVHLDIGQREQLVRKWVTQLVGALNHCHAASIYLTDFNWEDTVIDLGTSNLRLGAFDGMTDMMIKGELKLGAEWRLPPEMAHCNGPQLRLQIEKVEAWTLGVAVLELLGQGIPIPVDSVWQHFKKNPESLSLSLEALNISTDAQSFLLGLLQPKSSKRHSVEQISKHPWLAASNIPKDVYFDFESEQLQIMLADSDNTENGAQEKVVFTPNSDSPNKYSNSLPKKTQRLQLSSSSPTYGNTKLTRHQTPPPKRAHSSEGKPCGYLTLGSAVKSLPVHTGDLPKPTDNLQHEKPKDPMVVRLGFLNISKELENQSECHGHGDETCSMSDFVGDTSDEKEEDCIDSEYELDTPPTEVMPIFPWTLAMSLVFLAILWDMINPAREV